VFYLDSIDAAISVWEKGTLANVDAEFEAHLDNKCGLQTITSHGFSGSYGVETRRSIEVVFGQDNSGPHLNQHSGSCDTICSSLGSGCSCESIGTDGSASNGFYYGYDPTALPCVQIVGNCSSDLQPPPFAPVPTCPGPLDPEIAWTYCYCTSTSAGSETP